MMTADGQTFNDFWDEVYNIWEKMEDTELTSRLDEKKKFHAMMELIKRLRDQLAWYAQYLDDVDDDMMRECFGPGWRSMAGWGYGEEDY